MLIESFSDYLCSHKTNIEKRIIMEKANLNSLFCSCCIVFMTVFSLSAIAQAPHRVQPYSFNRSGVFYGHQPVAGIDMQTFVDLGYGYAKDRYNVYYEGRILPFVDPLTFRLNVPGSTFPEIYPSYPDESYAPFHPEGYVKTSNAVLFNGRKISDSPQNFQDLGWGYAKDSFDVYYMGRKIEGAMTSSFKVLKNGYAEDTFETYYRGKVVK